jgi:hypothetical protein
VNLWVLILCDVLNSVPKTHIDDEYAFAAEKDPKILLTTSRNPSAPLQQFVKVCLFSLYCWSFQRCSEHTLFRLFGAILNWLCIIIFIFLCRSWVLSFPMLKEWIVVIRLEPLPFYPLLSFSVFVTWKIDYLVVCSFIVLRGKIIFWLDNIIIL